ncbi:MAG TPA: LysR substrate-binding domain-containing protein [Gemmatimonadaceae bacterium]|nr:LysR substrate-binding domain-containing protein [Gemmatimonadaceae bacterium]
MLNLDLDTLRTLVVAHDLGGYAQAAARLGRTPSAISLQMKRLQTDVGAPIVRKAGRGVVLTEAGEIVLRYARRMLALNDEMLDTVRGAALVGRIRIGVSQDFAESVLPPALSRFTKLYPLVQLEVRIEGNGALVEAIDKDDIDLALVVGHANRPTAIPLGDIQLVWIAGREFVRRDGPLPLVVLGPQCVFRKQAIDQLDAAGHPWRIAAVSPSLAGLWALGQAGLGVTVRSALGVPKALISGKTLFDLPTLGAFPATLHTPAGRLSPGVERMRDILRDIATRTLDYQS